MASETSERSSAGPAQRRFVQTTHGRLALVDTLTTDDENVRRGCLPSAFFIHGLFFNADVWTHQLASLQDLRRLVAVDLLAHGQSDIGFAPLTLSLQADVVLSVIDELELDEVDLVAHDSGGAVAQIVATRAPERVRSLTLIDCEVHDNIPPAAFMPIVELARSGNLAAIVQGIAIDIDVNPQGARDVLETSAQNPADLPDWLLASWFSSFKDAERAAAVQQYIADMSPVDTVTLEPALRELNVPAAVIWGTDDPFFGLSWAYWLVDRLPGAAAVVPVDGGKLLLAVEHPDIVERELRSLWTRP